MMRYGRFLAAKRVAMAMQGLVRQRFPQDSIDFVGFYSGAARIPEYALPLVMPKPVTIYDYSVRLRVRLDDLDEAATRSLRRRQSRLREKLASLSARLETLSPLATLTRGYSVTTREDGSIVRDVQDVAANDILKTQVARGKITSRVVSTESSEK